MKRAAVFLLMLTLLCSLALTFPVLASGSCGETAARADALYKLGLFKGTQDGYRLDDAPDRITGIVMLIRLLGLEDEALSCEDAVPFTDLPDWGYKYVACAVKYGYTRGTSETTFSPGAPLDAGGYVTFLLRVLGYSEKDGDFSWDTALSDSAVLGLMDPASAAALSETEFNRGDMVDLSYCALTMTMPQKGVSLANYLCQSGVFTTIAGAETGVTSGHITYRYTPCKPAESAV